MPKGVRRSASEILADLEGRKAKLEQRAAVENANASPELAPLYEILSEADKALKARKRLFMESNPQAIANRLHIHQLWLNEINALASLTEQEIAYFEGRKDAARNAITTLANSKAEGNQITEDAVNEQLMLVPACPDAIADLQGTYESCKSARKAFSNGLRTEGESEPITDGNTLENTV